MTSTRAHRKSVLGQALAAEPLLRMLKQRGLITRGEEGEEDKRLQHRIDRS